MKLEEKAMPGRDKQKRRMSYAMRDSLSLTLLAVPGIVLLFIFNYLPMYGLSVAFKQFNPNFGIWKSPWVGWDNFEFFFTSQDAWRVLRNTVLYSLDFMFVGLFFAVLVALLLYNMRSQLGVKVYNTVMILPKFLSMVLIAFIVYSILNPASGILNQIIRAFGGTGKTDWYAKPEAWPWVITIVHVWQTVGMNSIVYYAALMAIDESLFEAAREHTSLYWVAQATGNPSMIAAAENAALRDVSISVSGSYGDVISAASGFSMTNVTLRANAYFHHATQGKIGGTYPGPSVSEKPYQLGSGTGGRKPLYAVAVRTSQGSAYLSG